MADISKVIYLVVGLILIFIVYGKRAILQIRRKSSSLSLVSGPECKSWLKGHMGELFDRVNGGKFHDDILRTYGGIAKLYGFLGDEQLYVSDPLAIQSIIVKDQDVYEETTVFIDNNKIIFGEGLVSTVGDMHKKQRKLVTPAFSVQRLRLLVPVFFDVAHRLRSALQDTIDRSDEKESGQTIDMAEWMSRAAIESIGCAGLGYSLDPLNSPATNPYTKTVRELIPALFSIAILRLLTPFVLHIGSPGFRRFILNLVPIKAVQKVKHMTDVMEKTCKEILAKKRTLRNSEVSVEDEILPADVRVDGDGKDVMSILLTSNESVEEAERLSDSELLGQMNVLIFGAQDTTSSALSRALETLSHGYNVTLQDNLRSEIVHAMNEMGGENLDFDVIMDRLPLLDAFLKETLRLYPPVPYVRRTATRTAILPLSKPVLLTNGTRVSQIAVPKGTTVWISIKGANRREDVWGPDAAKWDHRRWLFTTKSKSNAPRCDIQGIAVSDEHEETTGKPRHEINQKYVTDTGAGEAGNQGNQDTRSRLPGVFAGMLTFFGGSRSCVGYRFALLEMKIILLTLLVTFSFSKSHENEIVWRISQIVSPSYIAREETTSGERIHRSPEAQKHGERQGLPIRVTTLGSFLK